MLLKIFIGLLLLSLAINVWAIQCYMCESIYDESCSDDFDEEEYFKWNCSWAAAPRYLKETNDVDALNSTACMKRTYKVGDALRIERSCFFGDLNDTVDGCELDPALEQAVPISCHVCHNEDFCNHSSQLIARPPLQYLIAVGGAFVLIVNLLNWTS